MKKNIILLLSACLLSVGQAQADNRLTVSDVSVPQGGQATVEIGCEFDTEYTAFELQLALPEGLSLLVDEEDGKPVVARAFDGSHVVTGNLLPSNGNYKFTGYSTDKNSLSMPTGGPLFRVTLLADASLATGTTLTATVTACEFTRTSDSKGDNLADVGFNVSITESRTILDENATTAPVAEENANVRVLRTINAGEWSTICLPFAMTEEQTKEAFGSGVQIAEFNDYGYDDEAGTITVKFAPATAIEANHPYIIKVAEKVTEFTVDGVDISPEDEPMVDFDTSRRKNQPRQMVGTYVAGTVLEWGTLFLSGNQFWYSTGNTTMKGFRAYFNFNDLLPDFEEGYESRSITMNFGGGETTGIREIVNSKSSNSKYYDLQGRRVAKPSKGLFVKDGKKVVIK
ncbi:MAG: hypothetical protein IJ253_04510 [Bacteroidaceae bacterium]|nr:hypothetical protein [Bacteroidaceae bacterium]